MEQLTLDDAIQDRIIRGPWGRWSLSDFQRAGWSVYHTDEEFERVLEGRKRTKRKASAE